MLHYNFFRHYKYALQDTEIRTCLLVAAGKVKKGSKSEDSIRGVVEEYEALIHSVTGVADESEEAKVGDPSSSHMDIDGGVDADRELSESKTMVPGN